MGGRFRRWLVYPAFAALALIAIILITAHTPWARSRALAWATDFVTRFNLVLNARDLSYNALTRRVTLTDVRLAAKGHEDQPFLTAKRIEVKLPWEVYRRRFAIDQLDIDSGITTIIRDEHGVSNLPSGSSRTPTEPRRLRVYGLTLDTFDFSYVDKQHDFELFVPKIQTDLRHEVGRDFSPAGSAAGLFAIRGEMRLRMKDRRMSFAPVEAKLVYDGSNVALENVRLASTQINAVVKGRVDRVLDSPKLDLAIDGDVNLEPAANWISPPPVKVAGTSHIAGTMKGSFSEFILDLTTRGAGLTIGNESGLTMQGPVRVTLNGAKSDNITLTPKTGGAIRAQFDVPFGQDGTLTKADWQDLDADTAFHLGEIEPWPIGARFAGNLTFETGEDRKLDVFNRSSARGGGGDVPTDGVATFKIRGDDFIIDHNHRLNGMAVEGHTTGQFANATRKTATLGGNAHARISDIATAMQSLDGFGIKTPEILRRFHGDLDVPAELSGTFSEPHVRTHASGKAVDVPNLGVVSLEGDVVATKHVANITALEVHREKAIVTGDVSIDFDKETYTGALKLDAPDAAVLATAAPEQWRVGGPITATATLGGTFDAFRLDSKVSGTGLSFAAEIIDRATADAVITPDTVEVTALTLQQGEGQLSGQVKYNWETDALATNLKGDKLTYPLTLLSKNDTLASFSITTATGGTLERPTGTAEAHFRLTGENAGALIGTGDLRVDLLGERAKFVSKLPALGALIDGTVAMKTPYAYNVNATLDRLELAPLANLAGAKEGEVLGFISGMAAAAGRIADDQERSATIDIQQIDAGVGGVPVTLNTPAQVVMAGEEFTLKDINLRVGQGRLNASGQWTTKLNGKFQGHYDGQFEDIVHLGHAFGLPTTMDGTGPLKIDFTSAGNRASTVATLTLDAGTFSWGSTTPLLRDLTVRADMKGEALTISRITAKVSDDAAVGDFSATGSATVPSADLSTITGDLTIDTAKLTLSGVPVSQQRPSRVRMANGVISVADATWLVADNPLTFGGGINVVADDAALDLTAKGLVDLRVLSAFATSVAFDGTANVDARLNGTVAKPSLDGRITLDSAEIALSDPRIVLSDLSGALRLNGNSVVLENMKGFANGGTVELGGTIDVTGLTLAGGAISIQAEGVAMEFPKGFRSEVDGLVTYDPSLESPSITGDIRVRESSYTDPISLTAMARRSNAQPIGSRDQSYLDKIRLNVNAVTLEDATIDNNYGRFEAGAEIRVVGTVGRPGMSGRVTVREGGQLFLAGRTFRVTRGDISFTDLRKIEPEFNVAAEARVDGDVVTMTLTGTLEHPTVDLTSEEGSKTPGDIAASIVGGGTTAESALTLLSADLLGATGRRIGLDTLRFDRGDFSDSAFRDDPSLIANETDPATRLTMAKRLNEYVEVTYSQSLRENGKATFIFSVYPKSSVEIRSISRDNATFGLGVRHQVTFGGGSTQSKRAERPVVKTITFANLDPALQAQIKEHVEMNEGDRFEFIDLQKDIDRVREFLRGSGFFESRVRARRTNSDDGRTVAIEYSVNLGPRTFIVIKGIDLPPGEREALENAWTSSVFDQFLIDDLTNRVRRYLLTTDEIASVVVGRVDRAEGIKQLTIEVTPGAPVTGREIRYEGNLSVDTNQLKRNVDAAAIELEAWLDRTVIERAIRSIYVEEGYLDVKVEAHALTIDGTIGVLPVTIDEGPQAMITTINWNGVAEERKAMAFKAAALNPGTPYQPERIAEIREKVEDAYRGLGFVEVEIDINPEIDVADVVLNFDVVEGNQQVLADVKTTGAEVTRGEVITDALKFELGKPVNLDEWAQARKRLYDTSVFRLVDIRSVPAGDPKDGVQPVRAEVQVQEYPRWSVRYGAQVDGERTPSIGEFASSRNLGFIAELKNPNLFGRALNSGIYGEYQFDRRDVTTFLSTSRLFGWNARSSLYGFFTRTLSRNEERNETLAITDRSGVSAEQRWKRKLFQIVYGYRFERNHTYDPVVGANDIIPLDFVANLGTASIATLLDRRDNAIDPHKGTFSAISWEEAAGWLASDITNHKVLMQQFGFLSLGPRVVLASRVVAGFVFGEDAALPTDRFHAGGATSVRGYAENALGRADVLGQPVGGETLFVFNQEARFPIYKWVRGVGFVDFGNVFDREESLEWQQIRMGYGVGLRLDSPVGLLRVDFGIPKHLLTTPNARTPNTLKGGRWYFGLGHIF